MVMSWHTLRGWVLAPGEALPYLHTHVHKIPQLAQLCSVVMQTLSIGGTKSVSCNPMLVNTI